MGRTQLYREIKMQGAEKPTPMPPEVPH